MSWTMENGPTRPGKPKANARNLRAWRLQEGLPSCIHRPLPITSRHDWQPAAMPGNGAELLGLARFRVLQVAVGCSRSTSEVRVSCQGLEDGHWRGICGVWPRTSWPHLGKVLHRLHRLHLDSRRDERIKDAQYVGSVNFIDMLGNESVNGKVRINNGICHMLPRCRHTDIRQG